jgi:hypothetical protein
MGTPLVVFMVFMEVPQAYKKKLVRSAAGKRIVRFMQNPPRKCQFGKNSN